MAKQICPICNETKMGFGNYEKIKDGKICENCVKKIGLKFSVMANIPIMENLTIDRVKEMVENGETFDYTEEKAKRQQLKAEQKEQVNVEKAERREASEVNKEESKRQRNQDKQDSVESKKKQQEKDAKRLAEIEVQMIEAGVSDLFGTRKEVKSLPTILESDERIVYATSGFVGTGTMLVIISDRRLIFVDRGMLYGTNFREIPFKKINAVTYSTKLMFADISVENGVNTTTIGDVSKKTAPLFVDKLKTAIRDFESTQIQKVEINQQATSNSLADELTKLSGLKDAGILTEDEFNQQKAKLLNN